MMKRLLATPVLALVLAGCGGGGNSPATYTVRYTVQAGPLDVAPVSLTYRNANGGDTQVASQTLPFTLTFTATEGQFLFLSAQRGSSNGSVSVFITADGRDVRNATSTGPFVIASASALCC